MKIEQYEKIFISEHENEVFSAFEKMVEDIKRESNDPSTLDLVGSISTLLSELWEEIYDVE